METRLNPPFFLAERARRVVLDVRSPGEWTQGHIPGALNFPLFSDDERAAVGTVYKQRGREEALELGLRFVGPNMEQFVKQAKNLAPHRRVAIHCWRGGQRSGSMAWLLRQAGFDVVTLDGGYKSYRHHVLEGFEKTNLRLVILGGFTGTGKTKILRALPQFGEQILDLEALACHKGSAFGFIGEAPQPRVEQFENDLFEQVSLFDPARRVWVENESRSIGRVFIPADFWSKMKTAPLYNVEVPLASRIQNLLDDYVLTDRQELETAFHKIASKLGGQNLKAALEALHQGDYASAARIALAYYDKTYLHGLETNTAPEIRRLVFTQENSTEIARQLAGMD